jgi:hypothetical protein
MTYYHGGIPGLALGDEVLPPSVTGMQDSASRISREEFGVEYVRLDRVFLGASVDIASLYAAMYPARDGGWVYEVEPCGPLEPDPDYRGENPMDSVQAPSATIVRVLGPLAPDAVRAVRRALLGSLA